MTILSLLVEDFKYLVRIERFDAGLEPSGLYVSFCEGAVKGRVEVLEGVVAGRGTLGVQVADRRISLPRH